MFGWRRRQQQNAATRHRAHSHTSHNEAQGLSARREAFSSLSSSPSFEVPEHGPYDESWGALHELLDPENKGVAIADLGAYAFTSPEDINLAISTTSDGTVTCQLTDDAGTITMDVFAAPTSGGQWRHVASELAQGLKEQGAQVSIVDGEWGREICGVSPTSVIRFIGVDGPRWMLRTVVISHHDDATALAGKARTIMKHTVVRRGKEPMPARHPLPLRLSAEMQYALQQAQEEYESSQRLLAEQQRRRENSESFFPHTDD